MFNSLRWSFDGRLELEAHWRPPSLAGQFKLETHSAQVAEPHQRLESILLVVGIILVLPSVLALGLGALKFSLGLAYPYHAAFASSTLARSHLVDFNPSHPREEGKISVQRLLNPLRFPMAKVDGF